MTNILYIKNGSTNYKIGNDLGNTNNIGNKRHSMKGPCDACDERRNFEGCRYACFLSVADVGLFYRS